MIKQKKLNEYIYNLTYKSKSIIIDNDEEYLEIANINGYEVVSTRATNFSNVFKIETDQGFFFFKELPYQHIISELICAEIAEVLGMRVVDPHPVFFDERIGIIMPSYIPVNTKTQRYNVRDIFGIYLKSKFMNYTFNTFTLYDVIKEINNTGFWDYAELDKNMLYEMINISIFDFLTRQTDRNAGNLEVLHITDTNHQNILKLSPLYDNSFAFNIDTRLFNYIQNIIKNGEDKSKIFSALEQNGIFGINNRMRFLLELPEENKMNYLKNGILDSDLGNLNIDKYSEKNLENIAKLIHCNKNIENFYNKIQNLDIEKLFVNANEKLRKPIDPILKQVITTLLQHQIRTIQKSVENYNFASNMSSIKEQKEETNNNEK